MKTAFSSLALALGLLAGCSESPTPVAEMPAPILQGRQLRFPAGHPQLALLGVTAASAGQAITVELPARLVWNEARTQRIYPAFAGRVTAISTDVGQAVQPGSLLAQLASPDFAVAQAETAKAQADARLTRQSLQRQRDLFEAGIVARKDLEQTEADALRSQAEVARAEARTRLYGGGGGVDSALNLRSAIAGVVVERNLNPGQELRPEQFGPGAPVLFVVTDPSALWVQIDARESEADTLRPGATFELQVPALPGQRFEGRVTAAADAIDPATRTLKIRGLVPNPERRLKAEMLASVRFQRSLGAGVLVPAGAVTLRGTQHMVMVEVQPGVFESREVTLGYQGPREVVVARGLEVGERVVSENTLLLARQFRIAQDEASTERPADGKAAAGRSDRPAAAASQGAASQ